MLKKLSIGLVSLLFVFTACTNQAKETKTEAEVLSVSALMEKAADLVEKEVLVTGMVNHVCAHGGKKIHITTEEAKIIGTAGEGIEKFDTAFVGKNVVVKGILKEKRITKEEIEKMEADHGHGEEGHDHEGEEHKTEGTHHHAGDVAKLKELLEKSGKDYVSDFSIVIKEIKLKSCGDKEISESHEDCGSKKEEKKESNCCGDKA